MILPLGWGGNLGICTAGMHRAAFFASGRGRRKNFRVGAGQGQNPLGRTTVKLRAFLGRSGAVLKVRGSGAPIFPGAGAGRGVHPW